MKLFFRADDQVEQMQGRLQFGRNSCGFDKTVFAVAMTGKPPEIGAIVYVECRPAAIVASKTECFQNSRFCLRM